MELLILHNLRDNHFLFIRGESVRKNELFFQNDSHSDEVFLVGKVELGYAYYITLFKKIRWGIGASGALNFLPGEISNIYSSMPASFLIFTGIKLGT